MNALTLDTLRITGVRVLAAMTALLALVTVVGAFVMGPEGAIVAAVLAVALTIYPVLTALGNRIDPSARLCAAAGVVTVPALLLFVFQGAAWQIDLHMVFFAALAMVVILCDWRAIALATGIVAVHHLVIGMAMPTWVFPNGGSLGRVLLHAFILLAEAATLAWIARNVVSLIAAIEQAEQQRRETQVAIDAERSRQTQGAGEGHELLGAMAPDNQAQAFAIGQMDQSIQPNAAMFEKTSAAERSLSTEIEALAQKVEHFQLENGPAKRIVEKPANRWIGYVSPVRPLPVAAMVKANGHGALHAETADWKDF